MNVHPFIEAEKVAARSVARACVLLEVSRSAYYTQRAAAPSAREVVDVELAQQIATLHRASKGRYGAARVHAVLRRQGRRHSRKRVARLMAELGLRGRPPRRWKRPRSRLGRRGPPGDRIGRTSPSTRTTWTLVRAGTSPTP